MLSFVANKARNGTLQVCSTSPLSEADLHGGTGGVRRTIANLRFLQIPVMEPSSAIHHTECCRLPLLLQGLMDRGVTTIQHVASGRLCRMMPSQFCSSFLLASPVILASYNTAHPTQPNICFVLSQMFVHEM
jgi:hypothetical protein